MLPINERFTRLLGALVFAMAMLPLPATAVGFAVSPILVELDRNAKSGAITVSNDDDSESLRVQIKLFEWTQGASAKDEYRESEDLLFFPRLLALEKAEQKLVRVGLRVPAATQEKAYRLFVEELPAPPPPGGVPGARVAISVRFGVPIFVRPVKEELRGEIEKIELAKGVLRVAVRNGGNVHFTIKSITASSGEVFSKEAAGWYLLAGAAREHTVELPADACAKLKRLDVVVKTEPPLELKGSLDVTASMCRP
ncbi:fimbrial biogenesis chaperone [Sulfurisoma sediminicola]|uniref:Fimbrial chaperone protein n=1 Tax=Sulfurisoma sediminicola TaxID=1381557 RepID=A0A497XAX1_9PROT|nr:fimbria/pilus periplasmic chaperone [Sulfurisoma sediminicola]RLJ63715.1 fimbrial chaperone protein [Sulfurisoma sediminicola]